MLLLVAFVCCEEKNEEEEKASVCLFVGNERHCHHVENAAELKAELEKQRGGEHVRVARNGLGVHMSLMARSPAPKRPMRVLG